MMSAKLNLLSELKLLKGQKITEVISGTPLGSIIIMDLGVNYCLFVYSAWRLVNKGMIIATWRDDNEPSGNLVIRTKELTNLTILDVIMNEYLDLFITYSDGKILQIYCDILGDVADEFTENWCLANIGDNSAYIIYAINGYPDIRITPYYTRE